MRKIASIALFAASVLIAGVAFATDYSGYTNEELARIRGTLQNATEQEREAFRTEWQSRLQNMTQEERQLYSGRPENAPQGDQLKIRQRDRIHQQDAIQAGQGDQLKIRQRDRVHQQSAIQNRTTGVSRGAGSGATVSGGRGYGGTGHRGGR